MVTSQRIRVVVPVKSFSEAKLRLSPVLSPSQRTRLAEALATNVVEVARTFDVAVACDDDLVEKWARSQGAEVIRTDGLDLNGSARLALVDSAERGWTSVVIMHSDLPLARSLDAVVTGSTTDVVIVPDRHREGTNVLMVPTGSDFGFAYGPGSFEAHLREAANRGLTVDVIENPELSWDVDEPQDLELPVSQADVPPHLADLVADGVLRTSGSTGRSTTTVTASVGPGSEESGASR